MSTMTGLLGGSLPSLWLRTTPTTARGRHEQVRTRPRDQRRGAPHVIDQEVFRGALLRERKRAERFDQPFMLLLVGVEGAGLDPSSPQWSEIAAVLSAKTRDTDIVGWFDKGSALAVIVTEVDPADARLQSLERAVCQELEERLDPGAAARLSVRTHFYSSKSVMSGEPHPLDVHRPAAGRVVSDALKRALDVAGSVALLLLLLPACLIIAALVKLTSPGPVLFGQQRVGDKGRPFRMLKFRTMHVNADHAIHQQYIKQFIGSSDPARACARDGFFKIVNDPRVTPIGRFLRKTSLDELPQFWNVLVGEMSLVGPRPPLAYEVEQYKPWHYRRVLEAKPGITGLWQVTGRSRTTFDDMVRLDLRYARSHSVWSDVKILLATPRAVFSGKGAC
jgi:lipopolysaccharide/colanic/teichoic acid biosynthesis glycosyltransferase